MPRRDVGQELVDAEKAGGSAKVSEQLREMDGLLAAVIRSGRAKVAALLVEEGLGQKQNRQEDSHAVERNKQRACGRGRVWRHGQDVGAAR